MALVLMFSFSAGSATSVSANETEGTYDALISEEDVEILEDALQLIEHMPEELLEEGKEEERLDWMIDYTDNDELKSEIVLAKKMQNASVQPMGVYSCAKGIASAIVQLAVPVTKITKLKKVIKAAGGTKQFASKLMKYYKVYNQKQGYTKRQAMKKAIERVGKGHGPDVIDAMLSFLGVDAFVNGCLK